MSKRISLDVDRVLELYDSACKTCPECGQKMLPLDWSDYCKPCDLSIKRDYSLFKENRDLEETTNG